MLNDFERRTVVAKEVDTSEAFLDRVGDILDDDDAAWELWQVTMNMEFTLR